jgi:hypothetical protein
MGRIPVCGPVVARECARGMVSAEVRTLAPLNDKWVS